MFKLFQPYQNLFAVISTKHNGPMKLTKDLRNLENRKNFAASQAINYQDIVSCCLQHSNRVSIVNNKFITEIENCDGLITNRENLFLSITVADCAPIYFFDPENKVIALIHAGWRGLKNNIIINTIQLMKEVFNSQPKNILVGVGPCLCVNCYEVQRNFIKNFAEYPEVFTNKNQRLFFDMKYIIKEKLMEENILAKHIEFLPECTACSKNKYFSYRRDQYGCDLDNLQTQMAIFGIKIKN